MTQCPCGKTTKNPKFCSKSCAAKHNNGLRTYKRRAKQYFCSSCNIKTSKNCKTGKCRRCLSLYLIDQFGTKRLSDFQSTAARHRYQLVRAHAHRVMRLTDIPKQCKICGYSTHVELAHLRSIGSFAPDTLVSEVNDLNNLAFLCPNHHWELEHESRH